jgi:DmsE family decaheme c-type cytochrome
MIKVIRIGSILPILIIISFLTVSISLGMITDRETVIEQNELCLECHEDQAESLINSPHRLTSENDISSPITVGCYNCHDGWEEHIEDPDADNISSGPELSFNRQAEICAQCHATGHQISMVSTDPHGREGLGCSECHTVHSNSNFKLTKDDSQNFCSTCHTVTAAQFKNRTSHPLESENIRCTDCHTLDNIKKQNLMQGLDWTCQGCHPENAGPFLYEHKVTYSHLAEGQGCVECHNPHGSANDRLLTQAGDGICKQCHMVPPTHRTQHAGIGTHHSCIECHTEFHGSYSNNKFLDPDLNVKLVSDCYEAGCHILSKGGGF